MTKARVSTTGIATTSPITLYANSPENTDLAPNFKVVIPANIVGAMYAASADLTTDDSGDDVTVVIVEPGDGSSTGTGASVSSTPSIGDITVISNSVVYSDTGVPSVTLNLKIKNSSGKKLKGVNVRVQSL
jgi:hypothetical protein